MKENNFITTMNVVLEKLPSFLDEAKEEILLKHDDWDIITQNNQSIVTYKKQPVQELLQIAGIIKLSENTDCGRVLQLTTHTRYKQQHELVMELLDDSEKLNMFLNCVMILDERYSQTFTDFVTSVQSEVHSLTVDDSTEEEAL